MQCEELSGREEFTYSHMATSLERRGGARGGARDSYTVDVRASDLQLDQPEPLQHPCFSCRAWLYSALIGVRGATAGCVCVHVLFCFLVRGAWSAEECLSLAKWPRSLVLCFCVEKICFCFLLMLGGGLLNCMHGGEFYKKIRFNLIVPNCTVAALKKVELW